MNYIEREKLKRLEEKFSLNFRVTRMFTEYLERYPEIIKREMIEELTADGELTKREAVCALLSELFALDFNKPDDRRIILDYIGQSVRILDTEKYTSNPYYRYIAPEAVRDGDWEFRWEYYPPYRAAIADDMIMKDDYTEIPPLGFFTEGFSFPAVLEGGNEWMTITPVDVDTVTEAIADARGKVITFGLGLGYYAYMVSQKANVESVTVVEKSEKVIELFRRHILPKFPNGDKVRIISADAFSYAENEMPTEGYDYAFVDTWRDASDGLPMYERMKALEHLSPKTEFSYWIEKFILSRKRALRFDELMRAVERDDEGAPESYDDFIKKLAE
ncbi:MAG: hypothetical protein J6Q69_04345 [Clostridia bacterium]|nr:hypothetical protein [Clostridia bacterium]